LKGGKMIKELVVALILGFGIATLTYGVGRLIIEIVYLKGRKSARN